MYVYFIHYLHIHQNQDFHRILITQMMASTRTNIFDNNVDTKMVIVVASLVDE